LTVEGRTFINKEAGRDDPLSVRAGLTNGLTDGPSPGMATDDGLINGIARRSETRAERGPWLFRRSKKKRRAAREALGRKAAEPLPGADGR
jgi:hypothetical protein